MNTELQEKLRKYKEDLTAKLNEAVEERKELVEKVNSGENLTFKEGRRNKKLAEFIKEIKRRLEMFDEVSLYETIADDLQTLSKTGTTREEKDKLITKLVENFKKVSTVVSKGLLDSGIITEEDLKDMGGVKATLTKELDDLEKELELAKKRGFKTTDIEEEIAEKKDKLEAIEEYSKEVIDEKTLEKDLKSLSLSKTKKSDKDAILTKYKDIVSKYKNSTIEDIVIDMEENPLDLAVKTDSEDLEEETKGKLAQVTEWLKKHWKTGAKITGGIILAVAIIVVAKQCSKDIENSKNNDFDNNPTIGTTIDATTAKNIESLINKGYSEYAAVMMAENFNQNAIDTVLNSPYNAAVENYATTKEFNYSYLTDYENARTIYNITPENAVDYVNRAAKIQETGFYNDAEINEIVAVVAAIDNKNLFMAENNTLEHSINATLTDIYNNYAWTSETHENDAKKLDALQYFAKEGSDLDKFLTEYAEIAKGVLNAKGNAELVNTETNKMYTYLDTFANTFAGNSYDLENPNENAIVTDTYDWNIAYTSFIKPLMSMYINEQNVQNYICLQTNMLSNYEMWAQANGCELENGQSLTLGGE